MGQTIGTTSKSQRELRKSKIRYVGCGVGLCEGVREGVLLGEPDGVRPQTSSQNKVSLLGVPEGVLLGLPEGVEERWHRELLGHWLDIITRAQKLIENHRWDSLYRE